MDRPDLGAVPKLPKPAICLPPMWASGCSVAPVGTPISQDVPGMLAGAFVRAG